MFGKRVQADFRVNLEGGQIVEGVRAYRPGEVVSGQATITVGEDINTQHVTLQLNWFTEGKGDRDSGVVESRTIHQGVMTTGIPISTTFSFTLPQEPWSYTGHYINIIWAISIEIDRPGLQRDLHHDERFVMSPFLKASAPAAQSVALSTGPR